MRDGRRWAAVHDRSWRNLREEIDRKARADLRLISLTEYSTPGARRYAAIWEGAPAQAGDNLVFVKVDEATFQAVADRLAAAGLRPACAVRLGTRNHPRYACAWRLEESPPLWRASGPPVAELSSLDEVMRRYMSERRVTAAQLAVMRRGELVFSRAYTWGPASLRPTTTASRLRIASISKPITALAILRLVDQGRLSLSSPLAAVLPAAVAPLDPRIRRITIEDLLWHRGGWQIDDQRDAQGRLVRRGLGFDPMFQDRVVAALLRAGRLPIESEDVITFMFRLQRLQFDPGTAQSYSNFGFNVLGRVIEELTGQDYESYVREQILLPLGLRSFRIGRAPLAEQLPGEVLYLDARDAVSRDVHGSDALVPNQYGGWNLANMDSHGGWVCSAEELVRLAGAVLRGQVLSPASTAWYTMQRNYPTHNGSLPGTWTWLRVRGDVIYAVLTNQRAISRRADPGGRYAWSRTGQELSQRLDAAIDAIANWP
ncbi:MAG: hypothetical protein KatS3mg102_2035 [Planctomycetota bacterium]|nr:MAG: hypothetical protein KatS3mg102_2035 [Planctomycetota bacterium]